MILGETLQWKQSILKLISQHYITHVQMNGLSPKLILNTQNLIKPTLENIQYLHNYNPFIAFTVASWYTAWINIRSKGSPMVLTQHVFSKSLWEVTDIHSCSWHRTLRAAVELSLDFARAYKYLAGAPKQHQLTTRLDFIPPVDPQQIRLVNRT